MTLHLHNVNVNKMSTLLKLRPTNTGDIVMTFSLGNQCIQTFHPTELRSTQGIGMSGATSILSQLLVESVPLNTVKLPTR